LERQPPTVYLAQERRGDPRPTRRLLPLPQQPSLGTAIAGTILVAGITATPERAYGLAMIVLATVGLVGLAASALLSGARARQVP
jgi:hypothetical protein